LGFHSEGLRKLAYAQLFVSHQGMEQTQPGIVGKYFKDCRKATGLDRGQKGAILKRHVLATGLGL
jgi:hypothetical protein